MFEKLKKDQLMKLIYALLLMSISIFAIQILTSDTDGRKQIIDGDGGTEEELCMILSSIDGVGDVEVMLEYDEKSQVKGVIVIASGADNPVVKNNLTNGVSTLYDIPISSVIVFEKSKIKEESN